MTVFESLLNNTASLYRLQRTADGQGGWSMSYTANGTAECRIRPATSAEKTVAQQEERKITHVLYLVHGIDIRRGDQAVVQEMTVEIQAIREPSKADHHLEIDCLERQKEGQDIPQLVAWNLIGGGNWQLISGEDWEGLI